jgi:hypothetical protein
LVIIGNNQIVYENNLHSLPTIPNPNFGVKEGKKDGMDYRLLECSYQWEVPQLDKNRSNTNILFIFVPTNYINKLQPTNAILQNY